MPDVVEDRCFRDQDIDCLEMLSTFTGGQARSLTASQAADQQSIDFVRNLAQDVGWTPRAIDKLMYLACSGKFYLAGVELPKGQVQGRKRRLLESLRYL